MTKPRVMKHIFADMYDNLNSMLLSNASCLREIGSRLQDGSSPSLATLPANTSGEDSSKKRATKGTKKRKGEDGEVPALFISRCAPRRF